MLTSDDILVALRDCYDAVLPCNIVDLGMVVAVAVAVDSAAPGAGIVGVPRKHLVEVELMPASPGDEAEAQVRARAQIMNRLMGLEAVSRATVTVRDTPVWTPQRITAKGRRALGLDGNPALVQIR